MNVAMKHAFIISYDYPPCQAPGAAVRTEKFVRHLGEFGWRTTVLARAEPGRNHEVESGAEEVIRVASPTLSFSYQMTAWLWAILAYRRARLALRDQAFDLIYVSCPPFPMGLTASTLAGATGLPLLVDFRDPWSLDPYEPVSGLKRSIKRFLCRWVWPLAERRIRRAADRFLVVTPSMQRAYRRMPGHAIAPPILLPNGFDEDDFEVPRESEPSKRDSPESAELELLYCGRFSGVAHRSPKCLLQAIRILGEEGKRVHLRVLGDVSPELCGLISRTDTSGMVDLEPPVLNRQAISSMQDCDALVVYQEPSANDITAVAGKTYEYLRAGKPILSLAPPGDNTDLIERHARYSVVCPSHSTEQILKGLRGLYSDWESGNLPHCALPGKAFLERFDRRALTAQLASIFEEVLSEAEEGTAPAGFQPHRSPTTRLR